ncbi:MAG: META domain-containing protein, partial [Chloroflexota bacterium]
EGNTQGFNGCNRITTTYKQTGAGLIEFGDIGQTKVGCQGAQKVWEDQIAEALGMVRSVDLVSDQLYLKDMKGEHLIVLKAKR